MPEFLATEAIVLHKEQRGEQFLQFSALSPTDGLLVFRNRISHGNRSRTVSAPDWLDHLELNLRRTHGHALWYLVDAEVRRRFEEIARSYPAMENAAAFTGLLLANLAHLDTFQDAFALLHEALDAWASQPHPQVTLLKTLYRFARDEGFPVKEAWRRDLPPANRSSVATLLATPLSEIGAPPDDMDAILASLTDWLHRDAGFLPGK